MPERQRALVYRPGSLGDTLVSLPALGRLRDLYPRHRLSLLTEGHAGSARVSPWSILEHTGWFDDVHYYVVHPASAAQRWHNIKLAFTLRDRRFDHIFSLAPPRTSRQLQVDRAILGGLLGGDRYHAAQSPSWPPPAGEPGEHEGLRLLRVVDPSATVTDLLGARLRIPAAERALAHDMLGELGVGAGHVLVGVGPGSARASTTWPVERFAAVGRALLEQFREVVLLAIGGPQDQAACRELCAAWGPRSHNLAGRLSVFGSASVLSRCATFIGNDSGPTHLAAMVGIPCVAVFSARNAPGQWDPIGSHHIVLEERPACAGCMLDECVHEANRCLTGIDAGRVVREAVALIHSRSALCPAL